MTDVVLHLEQVSKLFGATRAVDRVSLEVQRGHVFTLLGPSGCGKTTTLRMIAGLERLDEGRIVFSGKTVADADTNEPTVIASVAMDLDNATLKLAHFRRQEIALLVL